MKKVQCALDKMDMGLKLNELNLNAGLLTQINQERNTQLTLFKKKVLNE